MSYYSYYGRYPSSYYYSPTLQRTYIYNPSRYYSSSYSSYYPYSSYEYYPTHKYTRSYAQDIVDRVNAADFRRRLRMGSLSPSTRWDPLDHLYEPPYSGYRRSVSPFDDGRVRMSVSRARSVSPFRSYYDSYYPGSRIYY